MKTKEENLKERLEELPGSIKTMQIQLLEMRDTQAEGLLKKKILEDNVYEVVHGETEPETGKPRYPNDAKRKLAVETRLGSHTTYQELNKELNKARRDIALKEIEIEYQSRQFRAAVAMIQLGENHE